jgi:hypothetical protein
LQQKLLSVINEHQGQWGTENYKEPVRKIWAALEFNFPLLFILTTPERGAGLTINYPVPNPEHVKLHSQDCRNITETSRKQKTAKHHRLLVV